MYVEWVHCLHEKHSEDMIANIYYIYVHNPYVQINDVCTKATTAELYLWTEGECVCVCVFGMMLLVLSAPFLSILPAYGSDGYGRLRYLVHRMLGILLHVDICPYEICKTAHLIVLPSSCNQDAPYKYIYINNGENQGDGYFTMY